MCYYQYYQLSNNNLFISLLIVFINVKLPFHDIFLHLNYSLEPKKDHAISSIPKNNGK